MKFSEIVYVDAYQQIKIHLELDFSFLAFWSFLVKIQTFRFDYCPAVSKAGYCHPALLYTVDPLISPLETNTTFYLGGGGWLINRNVSDITIILFF